MDFVVEKCPLDILKLPLVDMDRSLAYDAVNRVLVIVRTEKGYSRQWYDDIFRECPNELKDSKMCQEAYVINPELALFMPEEQISYEMVLELSKNRTSFWNGFGLERIPMKYRDYTICQNYITRISGINVKYVPDDVLDQNLCNLAMNQNGNSFGYIPARFRTYEMCLQAIQTTSVTISWIELAERTPIQYQTEEFWDAYHIRHQYFNRYNELDYNIPSRCQCKQCKNKIYTK